MTRRPPLLLALPLIVFVLWVGTSPAGAGPTGAAGPSAPVVRDVDLGGFPLVAVVVSGVPFVEAGEVRIEEDGEVLPVVRATPLGNAEDAPQVVLAIDVSDSMRGARLREAVARAREFVEAMPPDVALAVETFAARPRVLQPLTVDRSAALRAIGSIRRTSGGTALYDAVHAGVAAFSGDRQRNLVLLTDGEDHGSSNGLASAVRAARGAGVAVFAVGIRQTPAGSAVLRRLSESTRGTYTPVTEDQLAAAYARLASRLANQTSFTYRSEGAPGSSVSVRVVTPGGEARTRFRLPGGGGAGEGSPALLSGSTGLVVVSGLGFLALFVLSFLLLDAVQRSRRRRSLLVRIGVRGAPPSGERVRARRPRSLLPAPLVAAMEQMSQDGGFSEPVRRLLERAGWRLKPGEFLAVSGLAGLAAILVAMVGWPNPLSITLGAVAGAAAPWTALRVAARRRNKRFQEQLADVLTVLASSLRAGHSFFQALDTVAREIQEPGATEFARVVAEVRLGRRVPEALDAMALRLGSEDFRWAVLAINIQREVGGNLAEVLDTVAETVRERQVVRRQVKALAGEGKLSMGILSLLPIVVALYTLTVNAEYLGLLGTTGLGQMMVLGGALLWLAGIVWMQRVVRIDV